MPHELTAEDKNKSKAVCLVLLGDQRKQNILDRIVTCEEKGCIITMQAVKEGGQSEGRRFSLIKITSSHRLCDDQLNALHAGVVFDATSTIQPRYGAFRLLSVLDYYLDGTIFHSNDDVINEVDRFSGLTRHSSSQKGLKRF
ncbi:hypothetical protein TNCV_3732751 [Trichonephila clavipes]|nr:hypothetical protein TNCV_3732751 [Trichonephila clavipes]